MWHVFKHFSFPSHKSLEPVSSQITMSFKPHHFQAKSVQNLFKVCVSNTIFIFYFRIMQNLCLGFWKLGWVSYFLWKLFNFLIGLSPIWCLCIYAGPMWQLELVLSHVSSCSCIFYSVYKLLHVRRLTKCPNDILWLYWNQMSSFTWVYFDWTCFICFACV